MDLWTKVISAGVGPIIVISACGLLCLAFYNRFAAVVTRLRIFHREQIIEQDKLSRLQRAQGDDQALIRSQEILGMLHLQIISVSRRARLIRLTLGCLLTTIALLAACSLMVGLSVVVPQAVYVAVPLFVIGILLLIAAVVVAMFELRVAIDPVSIESEFIRQMTDDLSTPVEAAAPGDRH